jgi:hypothetical protein
MTRKLSTTSLFLPLSLLVLVLCTSNTFGQIDPSALYQITAKHSGKCLDVVGGTGAMANGVRVVQWDCTQEENQKWTVTPVGDGYYKIIAKHSGKSLDVFGGLVSQGDGVIVEQWDYNGGANQLWKLLPLGDDYYQIIAKHSGKSLDVNGGPTAVGNGAQLQQWGYIGADNQKFRLTSLRAACTSDQVGSTFEGRAEMIASRVSQEAFVQQVSLTIDFTQCRGNLRISNLAPITTREYTTTVGNNTTTVTLGSGGSGTFSAGRNIRVPVTLHFTHRLEQDERTASLARPSDLTLTLTGLVAADGQVTLTGAGTFVGGYLNGSNGNVTVIGRISPAP